MNLNMSERPHNLKSISPYGKVLSAQTSNSDIDLNTGMNKLGLGRVASDPLTLDITSKLGVRFNIDSKFFGEDITENYSSGLTPLTSSPKCSMLKNNVLKSHGIKLYETQEISGVKEQASYVSKLGTRVRSYREKLSAGSLNKISQDKKLEQEMLTLQQK